MKSLIVKIKILVYIFLEVMTKTLFFVIPKRKNQIMFGAWFGMKYIDNTKHVFEYLLDDNKLNVLWYTKDRSIYNKLREEGKPVVLANSLKAIWCQLRTKLFVSTVQMAEFNTFFVTHCKYLDLGHGHPIKDCGDIVNNKQSRFFFKLHQLYVDYYSAVCGELAAKIAISDHNTKPDHVYFVNFARNDVFFNGAFKNKELCNLPPYKGKLIVYMPTHRDEGRKTLKMQDVFDLDALNQLCEETNSYFIVKKHFYHRNESENLTNYKRIIDLSSTNIDPQLFLYKADILVTDYSACYVDYLLLNRPIIFYHFDYDEFQKKERSLLIPFSDINIAPKVRDKKLFVSILKEEIFDDKNRYENSRNEFIANYFKHPHPYHGREDSCKVIYNILNLNN